MSGVFGLCFYVCVPLCPVLQLLHICIEGWGNWRWSEAFSVDNVGTFLRTIQYKGRTASLIIKVVQLNGVQKQVLSPALCFGDNAVICCLVRFAL